MDDDYFPDPIEQIDGGWDLYIPNMEEDVIDIHKNDRYLVALFAIDDGTKVFRGNGVIVGPYLVTAAHVAQSEDGKKSYEQLCMVFEKKDIVVGNDDLIFDGRNKNDEDGCNKDLIIYKLKGVVGGFVCNEAILVQGQEMCSWYCNRVFEDKVAFNGGKCIIESLCAKDSRGTSVWRNCFKVFFPSRIKPGNSGCGVFVKNTLYGILLEEYLYSDGAFGKVLDARFIRNIIFEYESNNKS